MLTLPRQREGRDMTPKTESLDERDRLIAIVGMAARLPGACNVEQFWVNLRQGVESISFPSEEECLAAGIPPETLAKPGYVRAVASMLDVENFDAAMFGYTPREAAMSDPQIRAFLEVSHSALQDAGYDPFGFTESVGVYGSSGVNRYTDLHLAYAGDASSSSSMAIGTLNNMDYLATTVSYKLNLHGPSMFVATACSSSLVAVHLACQALRNGECDVAVAGGVDIEFPVGHGYQWDEGGPVSSDGHVRPFDARASGTVFGSGCGVVVLRRLSDALAGGDAIRAIIRGTAVNNDGSDKPGMTAPSIVGQAKMIAEAIGVAGVKPADIGYIEAHATGTPLGDPIEVAALTRAFQHFGGDLAAGTCGLGSVKANVGHLGHAAGVTSLIKAVLALVHEELPPTVNFGEANPKLALGQSPFYVSDRLSPWRPTAGAPRIAGVSSFGVGGTNCHLILEEAPEPELQPPADRPQVLVWSAKSDAAADAYREKLADHLVRPGLPALADIAGTLQHGRRAYPVRGAAVGSEAGEVAASLRAGAVMSGSSQVRRIAFCFPGQGAQQVRMAAGLYGSEPVFTEALDETFELFTAAGLELRAPWLAGPAEDLVGTLLAQPLLFAVESALVRTFESWGVRPGAVLGHSLGEFVAAHAAGVFDLPDAVRLVAARARAMARAPSGGMLAVAASPDECAALLPGQVPVAVVNGPRQTVVAGPTDQLDEAAALLRAHNLAVRRIATAGAFHTELMSEAATEFEQEFAGVGLREPRIAIYSAAAGHVVTDQARDPGFWARQLCEPVQFDRALGALVADGPALLLEIGPGRMITGLARERPEVRGGASAAIPALPAVSGEADGDLAAALRALAQVWADGHEVDWHAAGRRRPVRRVPLPGYQYQRKRHWVEPAQRPATVVPGRGAPVAAGTRIVAEQAEAGPFATLTWVEETRPAGHADRGPVDALALLPSDPAVTAQLIPAMHEAGLRVAIVRPGEGYAQVGDEFRVRPALRGDLADVLRVLAARGASPQLLVHALGLQPYSNITGQVVDEQLDDCFYSLVAVVQEGVRWPASGRQPGLLVLTADSVDITGAEPIDPAKAMIHGFLRSLTAEAPPPGCRLIDVGPGAADADLAAEIRLWAEHEVVALRGARRWTRQEAPAAAAQSAPLLRRRGVYLLTGGLGGLGRAVARGLARTGLCPRLVLLSRSGLPADAVGPRAEALRREIADLEALGCVVRVMAGDVTDRRAVRRALDAAAAHFGRLDGVVHLAGIPGDGMVQFRDRDALASVLAPKVAGTIALAEALEGRPPLDFLVFFSSRAAIDGLAGSADYAAANAFQDAFAQVLRRRQIPARSINWPSWSGAGMAVDHGPTRGRSAVSETLNWSTELGPEDYPLLDEHRIGDAPVLPGTAHLDLVVRAFRDVAPGGAEFPLLLQDVVFERIMVARKRRRVEVRFEPEGDRWRFAVLSAPAGAVDVPSVRHVRGFISVSPGWSPARRDVAAIEQALPVSIDDSEAPVPLVFTLGPRWQNIVRMRSRPDGDETELLAELELREPYRAETADHLLHPALLDSATSEVRRAGDGQHLPFLYESLAVRDRLPHRFLSHIKRRATAPEGLIAADVTVLDEQGVVLAEIQGFTMRKVDDLPSLAAAEDAGPDGGSVTGSGIPPDEGARLFLSLLGEGGQSQVVVRPYADGRPVPLSAFPAGPAAAAAPVAPRQAANASEAVPDQQAAKSAGTPGGAEPVTGGPIETRLRELWVHAIGQTDIPPDADFFELGGNSLTAVELMSDIRAAFGVDLSIAALFDYPTIASLANALTEQGAR
jgi:phthiocerol/phenolphthiocerol synthesis type-I polyketide synthase E